MKTKVILILSLLMAVLPAAPATARFSRTTSLKRKIIEKAVAPAFDERLLAAAQLASESAWTRSRRRCWQAVKNALLAANVVAYRPATRYARQAGDELEAKFDFEKLDVTDPFAAPVGSILVYGGRGAGHVEFRTAFGFVSDFIAERPSRRPLLGVYVKRS